MKRVLHIVLLVAFMSMLFSSCLEREELAVRDSDCITFIAELNSPNTANVKSVSTYFTMETQEWDLELGTKATLTSKLEGNAKVTGVLSESSGNKAYFQPLNDATYAFDDGDKLSSSTTVRWGQIDPKYNSIKLFVYSPLQMEGAEITDTPVDFTGPKITYILPTDHTKHTDFITAVKEVATKGNDGFNKTVPLTFTHALTALKFKMGFPAIVKSITISGVYNKAVYTIGTGWGSHEKVIGDYTVNSVDDIIMMIPQTLPFEAQDDPRITVKYTESTQGGEKTISASLKGLKWDEGKMITYTLYKNETQEYIYFDLDAGNITIDNNNYSGYVYINGKADTVWGYHHADNKYYVYQSSSTTEERFLSYQKGSTGYTSAADRTARTNCRIPKYDLVTYNNKLWSDFITNNTNVEEVIETWDDGLNVKGSTATGELRVGTAVVRDVGRSHTNNYIKITGSNATYDLTIDNIYSVIQDSENRNREKGGISYSPQGGTTLNVTILGDNRMGCLHICNKTTDFIYIGGTGSLTVADTDFKTKTGKGLSSTDYGDLQNYGYVSNYQNSAIGNNTYEGKENVYNLHINSGVIFAGTTKMDDCTAIGAGGNGYGEVNIHGGIVTAVSTTAGATIGGGMGHSASGGPGKVTISGGNVYAYNFANRWKIASSAIGGGGSSGQEGSDGEVNITGGNIYAYSDLGTGIGGGSSNNKKGGNANITITGGYIIAKSGGANGIGGGNGGSGSNMNGGTANITISGNPIIRTGSIGGGKTLSKTGNIGSANINISGGDIQAQFVMAAGATSRPEFRMSGTAIIRNSYTTDNEYIHVQDKGGAVYMEDGVFEMSGGTIQNCYAQTGGAVYIEGDANTKFTMTGGEIKDCNSSTHGGAVYLKGGEVVLSGGSINNNLAESGNGGGVCVVGGNFKMPAGGNAKIEDNAANSKNVPGCGSGGGIYVTSTSGAVTVDLLSGTIKDNTADRTGGGLGVNVSEGSNVSADVTVGEEGASTNQNPLVTGNRASIFGGGLYVNGAKANIVINDGKILDNFTSGYVSNPNVANDGGMVTLNGGDVTHVVVTYMPNTPDNAYITVTDNNGNAVQYLEQKIVTATNSKMVIPGTFTRPQWEIYAWHTRPDGDDSRGKRYATGAILNLNSDVTLYALWREIQ